MKLRDLLEVISSYETIRLEGYSTKKPTRTIVIGRKGDALFKELAEKNLDCDVLNIASLRTPDEDFHIYLDLTYTKVSIKIKES